MMESTCTSDDCAAPAPRAPLKKEELIRQIPQGKGFEDFYFVGNKLKICADNPSSTRPVLKEVLDVPTLRSRVVKIINRSRIPASAGGERLWRRLCERLLGLDEHPNLMRIHEVLESCEHYFIVMEQMQGGELFDFLLNERAVPEETCKYVMRQILRGVDHLHSNHLLHRDLKPENLMFRNAKQSSTSVTQMYELAIIDFDTCKMLDIDPLEYKEVVNGKRRLVGTYGYLAPEVLKGAEYSKASDMWSVGVILYILMTGVPPLPMDCMNSAKESIEVLKRAEAEGIDFDLSPLPEFPRSRDLCMRLLQFNPAKRLTETKEALRHPWLVQRQVKAPPQPLANAMEIEGIKHHNQRPSGSTADVASPSTSGTTPFASWDAQQGDNLRSGSGHRPSDMSSAVTPQQGLTPALPSLFHIPPQVNMPVAAQPACASAPPTSGDQDGQIRAAGGKTSASLTLPARAPSREPLTPLTPQPPHLF
ncbi:unnamed protein product [Vitrella brassicaformis CCMP3155]|uniref:Protein kinase domain-containing protein n=2 Tax=Vitrella brassicaformis TaxID=1169539 RepID=A0A0G4ESE8_VITBC|nr:unnamed protein product [Vitrella brassicaformis CCMP3155]|eukprot:CEM00842.1 unnamed protein product [Vitrella brassicaformis CCMP3155]